MLNSDFKKTKGRGVSPAFLIKEGENLTDISKEILEKYQIRKTKEQKTRFIEFMRAHFPEIKVEEGGFGKNRNLVIGNPESAKAVLTAHYDTCAVIPFPNFVMPKNFLFSILYGVLICLPVIILGFLAAALALRFTDSAILGEAAYLAVVIGFLYMVYAGKPNRHTVNDNTSGVITLVEFMSTMTDEERSQYCFVFFDNEEKGLFGSGFFKKIHKETMKDRLLINFDCVSDGDYLMLIPHKSIFSRYEGKLREAFLGINDKTVLIESSGGTYYPSDQKKFPVNIGVASFKKGPFGLYMDRIHTPRDTVMDERNIAVLIEGFRKFLSTI